MIQTVSTQYDWNEVSDELDKRFEISFNTYKLFACGLIFGRAAEDEYADAIVARSDTVALRRKLVATADDSIDEASASPAQTGIAPIMPP